MEPLISQFAPLNFAFNFCASEFRAPSDFAHPYFTVDLPFSHSFVAFFLLPLIFALSYCANLPPLTFAQAIDAGKLKGREF